MCVDGCIFAAEIQKKCLVIGFPYCRVLTSSLNGGFDFTTTSLPQISMMRVFNLTAYTHAVSRRNLRYACSVQTPLTGD
jgi:hypothetical protein